VYKWERKFAQVLPLKNIARIVPRTGKALSKETKPCEISGSHGGEYEDGCLLGCWVV
jgi:hypothetical protein